MDSQFTDGPSDPPKRRATRRRKSDPISDPTPPGSESESQAGTPAPPAYQLDGDDIPSPAVLAALIRGGGDAPVFDAPAAAAAPSPPARDEGPRVVMATLPAMAEMPADIDPQFVAGEPAPSREDAPAVAAAPRTMASPPADTGSSPSAAPARPLVAAAPAKTASPTSWMVAVVAIVIGSVLGVYAANTYQDEAAQQAHAQARPEDNSLAAQVRELARQVEALRLQLAEPGQAAPAPATAQQLLADVAELRAAVEALTAALIDMPVAADHSLLSVPAYDSARRSKLEQQLNHDDEGLRERHLFWTAQELLDAYGAPDFIAVQDGVEQWSYSFPSGAVGFAMHLGRVIEVYAS